MSVGGQNNNLHKILKILTLKENTKNLTIKIKKLCLSKDSKGSDKILKIGRQYLHHTKLTQNL